jgi:hypothetical protein
VYEKEWRYKPSPKKPRKSPLNFPQSQQNLPKNPKSHFSSISFPNWTSKKKTHLKKIDFPTK